MADCKKKKIQTLQLFSLGPLRSRENEITLHNVQKFCKLTKPRKMSFFFSLLIIAANDFFVFFACDDISFPRVLLTLFPNRLLFDGWIFSWLTFSHKVLTWASVNWLHSFNCSIHWSRSFVVALSSIAVEVEEKVSSIFVDSILTAFINTEGRRKFYIIQDNGIG